MVMGYYDGNTVTAMWNYAQNFALRTAVDGGNMPAVSFLEAPAYQDGHAGYSNPLDEQEFLVTTP